MSKYKITNDSVKESGGRTQMKVVFIRDDGTESVTSPYLIGETEVTYELWYKVKSSVSGYTFANDGREGNDGVTNAVATEDIAVDATGTAIMSGSLYPLDTLTPGWLEGDILWLGDNGIMTNIKPTSGFEQPIAFVLRESTTVGALQINIVKPIQEAVDVRFDPSTSALSSINTQTAIKELSDEIVTIPKLGDAESLNVAYAAAVIISQLTR